MTTKATNTTTARPVPAAPTSDAPAAKPCADCARTAFEATLTVGQVVYLRYAIDRYDHTADVRDYGPPGARANIEDVTDAVHGRIFYCRFHARRTKNGMEKTATAYEWLDAAMLCASPKEARHA